MATVKVYARQVPPEYQESPFTWGDFSENVYVFGNRYYNEHVEGLQEIRDALENIADEFEAMQAGNPYTTNLHAAIWYEMPRDSGEGYTRAERLEIVRLAEEYKHALSWSDAEIDAILRALEIVRGEEYKCVTLRGCCQGNWQYCIYPAAYGDTFREMFEIEYFNTGTEWIIHDGDDVPEEPEEIEGYSMYCYSYDPRTEIAAEHGVQPEEVQLYTFAGYTRRASWEVA